MHNTNNNNNRAFTPLVRYHNLILEKSEILFNNKGRTGIYLWTHVESGKIYLSSAFELSDRLRRYFSTSELKRGDNYIYRALISHTHSTFSLAILEYINITNLSKKRST